MPVLGDFLRKKHISKTCGSVEECGGVVQSLLSFAVYFTFVEFVTFFDHWYILHVWKWGKKHMKHDVHHKFERSDEMTTFTGFAFDAVDGFSQGLGITLGQLVVPVPVTWVLTFSFAIGLWTMYIHCGVPSLPWPFMGADYHFVHHKYNWYGV